MHKEKKSFVKSKNTSKASLFIAVVAAIAASLCCVGPLLLLTLGIGGAWMSNLTALEPVRPFAIAFTILFLGIAFWKLYIRPTCDDPNLCKKPSNVRLQKIIFWVITLLATILLSFPWYAFLFY